MGRADFLPTLRCGLPRGPLLVCLAVAASAPVVWGRPPASPEEAAPAPGASAPRPATAGDHAAALEARRAAFARELASAQARTAAARAEFEGARALLSEAERRRREWDDRQDRAPATVAARGAARDAAATALAQAQAHHAAYAAALEDELALAVRGTELFPRAELAALGEDPAARALRATLAAHETTARDRVWALLDERRAVEAAGEKLRRRAYEPPSEPPPGSPPASEATAGAGAGTAPGAPAAGTAGGTALALPPATPGRNLATLATLCERRLGAEQTATDPAARAAHAAVLAALLAEWAAMLAAERAQLETPLAEVSARRAELERTFALESDRAPVAALHEHLQARRTALDAEQARVAALADDVRVRQAQYRARQTAAAPAGPRSLREKLLLLAAAAIGALLAAGAAWVLPRGWLVARGAPDARARGAALGRAGLLAVAAAGTAGVVTAIVDLLGAELGLAAAVGVGACGVAALALRPLLADWAAGLALLATPPWRIGDAVTIAGQSGIVTGWALGSVPLRGVRGPVRVRCGAADATENHSRAHGHWLLDIGAPGAEDARRLTDQLTAASGAAPLRVLLLSERGGVLLRVFQSAEAAGAAASVPEADLVARADRLAHAACGAAPAPPCYSRAEWWNGRAGADPNAPPDVTPSPLPRGRAGTLRPETDPVPVSGGTPPFPKDAP